MGSAAVAGLSYINAKTAFWYDWLMIRSVVPTRLQMWSRERNDRINAFYLLESYAKDKATADVVFLKFEGRSHTYAQTYDSVLRYGAWLRKAHGVKPKDIVAMDFENSDTFVFLWFGIWSIGAKPAFINFNLSGSVLTHCVKAADASLLLVDPNVAGNVTDDVRKELESVNIVVLTPELEREVQATEPVRAPDADRSEDLPHNMSILIFTSGTTGMPKPAIMSWAKAILGAGFASRWLGWKPGDIFYTVRITLPLRLSPFSAPTLPTLKYHLGHRIDIVRRPCLSITAQLPCWAFFRPWKPARLLPSAGSSRPPDSGKRSEPMMLPSSST